jgi:protease-4
MSLQADALADRRRLRRKLSFWRIAAFIIALLAILAGFGLTGEDGGLWPTDHVARVEINGIITDDREQQKLLRQIAENDHAKALLLEIDSPGGTTTGAEALFEAVREVADKKPVVATLGTIAASGGYIAAIGADHIVARGNTLAGSIGVIMQWPNAKQLLDRVGIEVRSVKSSPIKAEPTPYTDPPPEAIAVLETAIADSYDWFIGLVRERRDLLPEEARRVGDARILTGRDALEAKLVDAIGGADVARAWLESEHAISSDLELKTYEPRDPLDRGGGGAALVRFLSRLTGVDLGAVIIPGGTALDGLVSVWHPEIANRH